MTAGIHQATTSALRAAGRLLPLLLAAAAWAVGPAAAQGPAVYAFKYEGACGDM